MPSNQNPVYVDNSTILGDGTVEDPLHGGSSGSIAEITSDDASIDVTNPTGPTVDLSIATPPSIAGQSAVYLLVATNPSGPPNLVKSSIWALEDNGSGGTALVAREAAGASALTNFQNSSGGFYL